MRDKSRDKVKNQGFIPTFIFILLYLMVNFAFHVCLLPKQKTKISQIDGPVKDANLILSLLLYRMQMLLIM